MLLELRAAMGINSLDGTCREQGAQCERHRRGIPDFRACRLDEKREALPAPFRIAGNGVPARFGPGLIGFPPPLRKSDLASLQLRADLIPNTVQRSDALVSEPGRLLKNGLDQI